MTSNLSLCVVEEGDKPAIFRLRHEVYAVELRQYEANVEQTLYDAPEVQSVYLTLLAERELIGFVGITPPASPRFRLISICDEKSSHSRLMIVFMKFVH